jgi:hypothetical protein
MDGFENSVLSSVGDNLTPQDVRNHFHVGGSRALVGSNESVQDEIRKTLQHKIRQMVEQTEQRIRDVAKPDHAAASLGG